MGQISKAMLKVIEADKAVNECEDLDTRQGLIKELARAEDGYEQELKKPMAEMIRRAMRHGGRHD